MHLKLKIEFKISIFFAPFLNCDCRLFVYRQTLRSWLGYFPCLLKDYVRVSYLLRSEMSDELKCA